MSERDGFPDGVPCWVECLTPDPVATGRFYAAVFGWKLDGPGPMPGREPAYWVARLRGRDVAGVAPLPPDGEVSPAWMTQVAVDDADAAAERVRAAGGTVLAGPIDLPPVGRLVVIQDPEGAGICAFQPADRAGAQLVNEPGAWSMSALTAADLPAAATFYGAVFGWEPEEWQGVTLFRLPGFVGGEPSQPVPRDVVAVGFRGDGPARWDVDFWTDDAERVAATAVERGGRVVVEPHPQADFRTVVVADPAGATFSASQLLSAPAPSAG
jgi:predicted enzyme related to lactoylglutathione lyase